MLNLNSKQIDPLPFNDKLYVFLDSPHIPSGFPSKTTGWYELDCVYNGQADQIVLPNKELLRKAIVAVIKSNQRIIKFKCAPAKTGVRVPNAVMDSVKSLSVSVDYHSQYGAVTEQERNSRIREKGFTVDEYNNYWTVCTPYYVASREYLDLFYFFRSVGVKPVPSPKSADDKTVNENNTPDCDSC